MHGVDHALLGFVGKHDEAGAGVSVSALLLGLCVGSDRRGVAAGVDAGQ